jgi:hypothetical protein
VIFRISASTARAASGVPLASNTSTPSSETMTTEFSSRPTSL